MSLVSSKLGRFAFGLAASGSLALLCAGTALADSSTPSDTPTVTAITQTANVASVTTTTITKSVVTGVVANADGSSKGGPSDSGMATPTQLNATLSTVAAPVDQTSATPPSASIISNPTDTPAIPEVVATPAQPTPITQALIHRSDMTVISMPSQPTSYAPLAPVAPSHTKQPVPPKANGLFTAIASELAGVTVPELFHPLLGLTATVVSQVLIAGLTLVAVLLSVTSLTYGQLLRRSGYVTAARSNVVSFTFATPHLIDYGSFRLPIVLFNGVRDQKTPYLMFANAYQKGGE